MPLAADILPILTGPAPVAVLRSRCADRLTRSSRRPGAHRGVGGVEIPKPPPDPPPEPVPDGPREPDPDGPERPPLDLPPDQPPRPAARAGE